MCPFGYSYAIPYQLGYLKKALNIAGLPAHCFDLNIDFHQRYNLKLKYYLSKSNLSTKYSKKSKFLSVQNWDNEAMFRDELLDDLRPLLGEYARLLVRNEPLFVGFTIFNTNRAFTLELCRQIREISPQTKIVWGGPDCTSNFNNHDSRLMEEVLQTGLVDCVVVGEAENTVIELQQALADGTGLNGIAGLMFLDGSSEGKNEPVFTGHRALIKNLDDIAYPDYSDFDFDLYTESAFPLAFNRGCNFRCVFCDINLVWRNSFRRRSARNIADEILYLAKLSPYKTVFFNGAYVNTSRRLLNDLADILIEEWGGRPQLYWSGYGHFAKNLDHETCRKLRKAGCTRIVFGFESGSPKVVADMKKGYTHDIAIDNIRAIHAAGIKTTLFTIVGFPTETEADFQMTLDFLSEHRRYIDAAYCNSEFILGDRIRQAPESYAINVLPESEPHAWRSLDGENTSEVRRDRLQRFYQHCKKLGIRN